MHLAALKHALSQELIVERVRVELELIITAYAGLMPRGERWRVEVLRICLCYGVLFHRHVKAYEVRPAVL